MDLNLLPPEILHLILRHLHTTGEIHSLAQTSSFFYSIVSDYARSRLRPAVNVNNRPLRWFCCLSILHHRFEKFPPIEAPFPIDLPPELRGRWRILRSYLKSATREGEMELVLHLFRIYWRKIGGPYVLLRFLACQGTGDLLKRLLENPEICFTQSSDLKLKGLRFLKKLLGGAIHRDQIELLQTIWEEWLPEFQIRLTQGDQEEVLAWAAMTGRREIISYLRQQGIKVSDLVLESAARGSQGELVCQLLEESDEVTLRRYLVASRGVFFPPLEESDDVTLRRYLVASRGVFFPPEPTDWSHLNQPIQTLALLSDRFLKPKDSKIEFSKSDLQELLEQIIECALIRNLHEAVEFFTSHLREPIWKLNLSHFLTIQPEKRRSLLTRLENFEQAIARSFRRSRPWNQALETLLSKQGDSFELLEIVFWQAIRENHSGAFEETLNRGPMIEARGLPRALNENVCLTQIFLNRLETSSWRGNLPRTDDLIREAEETGAKEFLTQLRLTLMSQID